MIRFGTGTYNVRDSEGIQPQLHNTEHTSTLTSTSGKSATSMLKCTVFFLDDTEHEFEFHKNAVGDELLEKVYGYLDLMERDFFGLQFVCIMDVDSSGSRMLWLDAKKSIKKQMMCPPYHLFFRVKFYVSDPSKLIEEYTRYQVYLQLRKDILEGKLPCTENEAAVLGSYAVQSEMGDFSSEDHKEGYLDGFRVIPNQGPEVGKKMAQLHRHHVGQFPADAEFKFLDVAKGLYLYGFDLYEAKDGDGYEIYLGINCSGISIFQSGRILNSFPWAIIIKLSFKRKLFYVEMKELEHGKHKDSLYIFNAVSPPNCKMLWKSCIEHHTFFRLIAPPTVPQKSLFYLGSRFRYSGRTEYQSVEEMRRRAHMEQRNFHRHCSMTKKGVATTFDVDGVGELEGQPSSSLSNASHTSNSSAFSATSAADFAARLSSESAAPTLSNHRRSYVAGTPASSINGTAVSLASQSVVLRNPNAAPSPSNGSSTLSLRIRPSSHNSSILGVEEVLSPAASSAYSSATTRSSLILPGSTGSSNGQFYHASYRAGDELRLSPYDSASTTILASSSTATLSNSTDEASSGGKGWQSSPNHTTTMIINDPGSQACTSGASHHHCNNLSLTSNSCRKSMVLNGSAATSVPHGNGTVNGVSNGELTKNGGYSLNGSHNDYGSVSRRSIMNGTSPSSYKSSPRVVQSAHSKLINSTSNGSPRNSVISYSSLYNNGSAANGGYENGSLRARQSPTRQHSNSPSSIASEDSAVIVRMVPDVRGRFGFTVTGGYDRGYPVIVSRVVTGSPADKCHPRLNVGDMVLKISGIDISMWSYDRVVSSIRNSSGQGEITLTIKPNVYRCGEMDDNEPQIAPEVMHVAETVPRSDKLAQSLLLMRESLDTGKIVRQFEQLYRKKPGLPMNDSRLNININKNRYRDVVPYDSTRVRLDKAPNGDYINANHVNMEIPSSGIVNRYIATQGPLAHTTPDFWYMVWEQGCTTIVMLTTLVEKGRIKCHQYWPSRKETLECGNLQITNVNERLEAHCHYRELSIRNKMTREERRATQMQYTAWPDHGVPDNPRHFIDFISEVRRARTGSLDPILVHCSAGIGRTGVLILMETAACLIEANEPVYPLDIVRIMRDQRAMLIQTSDQYTFVCESILRAYKDNTIRPLAEYQKCR